MPNFEEFSREDSRSRRQAPMFTLQARGTLTLNNAVYEALGEPAAVALLYDADEDVVALRKVEEGHPNGYPVRQHQGSQSYLVGMKGFTSHYGISTLTARRFVARQYGDAIWGFALAEGQAVQNRRGAQEAGPAETGGWRHTMNGFEVPALMRIGDVGMSHRGYMMRQPLGRPPLMRVGALVACDPLGPEPTTSELRMRFLRFLAQRPVMDLVSAVSQVPAGVSWTSLAGHGRVNLEAALGGSDETAPVASALLLLPEVGMSQFGRDPRYAELVVDIEPRDAAGKPAAPVNLAAWHDRFSRALEVPPALAGFLAQELGLATMGDPPAQAGVWLKTPHAMTELVDLESLKSLDQSAMAGMFIGYVVADRAGKSAAGAAVDLLRQMCDYTLHLDQYELALDSLPDVVAG